MFTCTLDCCLHHGIRMNIVSDKANFCNIQTRCPYSLPSLKVVREILWMIFVFICCLLYAIAHKCQNTFVHYSYTVSRQLVIINWESDCVDQSDCKNAIVSSKFILIHKIYGLKGRAVACLYNPDFIFWLVEIMHVHNSVYNKSSQNALSESKWSNLSIFTLTAEKDIMLISFANIHLPAIVNIRKSLLSFLR